MKQMIEELVETLSVGAFAESVEKLEPASQVYVYKLAMKEVSSERAVALHTAPAVRLAREELGALTVRK